MTSKEGIITAGSTHIARTRKLFCIQCIPGIQAHYYWECKNTNLHIRTLLCYFVSVLHSPPRCLRALRVPLACCLLSCVLAVYLFYFSSLPSLFRFRFGHRYFILSFSCGYYAVSSLSVSAATRLASYDMYLDTYVR